MENDMNDVFAWNEEDGGAITLFDDDGNESSFNVLSSKEHEGNLYLLVAEAPGMTDEEDEEEDENGNEDDENDESGVDDEDDDNEDESENIDNLEADDDTIIEVMHFKCISNEGDVMAFETVDEEHPDFALVLTLFKDDYEALDIDIVDDEISDDDDDDDNDDDE